MSHNSLRIIGGKWRGRKIAFPSIEGLRPTHDRIRETLFNWLMHDIVDANCLDLFAGSGALGFEALSRGANSVTFVERDARAGRFLNETAAFLDTKAAHIVQQAYQEINVVLLNRPFDIVFLDPPFDQGLLRDAIAWLMQNGILSAYAKIYIEVEKDGLEVNMPDNWQCSRHKSTSTLDYYLFSQSSV